MIETIFNKIRLFLNNLPNILKSILGKKILK